MPLSDRRAEELIRIYSAAEDRIKSRMASVILTTPTVKRKRRTIAEIRDIIARLEETSKPAEKRLVTASYEEGMKAAKAAGRITGPHVEAVNALAGALASNLDAARGTIGRSVDDVFRELTLRSVAERMSTGERPSARALEQQLRARGQTGFVDRRGRRWKLSAYTKMAVRTVSAEAQTHGVVNRMLERGLDIVTISSHDHPNDVCSPYDGKTFSLTGAVEGFPILLMMPPFHPNCKHRLYVAAANSNVIVHPSSLRLVGDRYIEAARRAA